jgi:multiple sugar transport system permease protein
MNKSRKEALVAAGFLAPNIVGFFAFTIGPIIASIYLSFTEWNLINAPKWIGLKNFSVLLNDPHFIEVSLNTLVFTIATVPLGIFLALFFAIFLNMKIPAVSMFRTIFFIPVIATMTGVAMLWRWLLQDDIGLVFYLLSLIGVKSPHFLSSTEWALFSVSIVSIWKRLGYDIVLILAGLQGIDPTYYEVAEIDGASRLQRLRKVMLPLLSPTMFFVIIMGVINSFQVFDQTFVLTKGGPAYSTTTLVYYVYLQGFETMRMGRACAISLFLFVVVMIITLIQWSAQKRWVNY